MVHLALEAIQRAEDYTWIEAEVEAGLVEEAGLKAKEDEED